MATIKINKPTSPGRRDYISISDPELSKDRPVKKLVTPNKSINGRNNYGRITVRRRGNGHKRKYRLIDFKRNKENIPARVAAIEYDPNRTANIALLFYADGEKRYILSPKGIKVGDFVEAGPDVDIKRGNCLSMANMPMGTVIHNIEMKIGKGGQLVRSAGMSARLMAKEGNHVLVKLPSGEVRRAHKFCRATVGQIGNIEHESKSIGKAGRNRRKGLRPKVRGVAMNPVDHPMGGGEGKSSGGRHPCTPWGVPTNGYRTRRNKVSDKDIVRRRS